MVLYATNKFENHLSINIKTMKMQRKTFNL